MDANAADISLPWYRLLNREQWRVLAASNLGWLFDGFELYALFLTVGFALRQLLDVAQQAQVPRYAGYILATTVFGWATGGVIGGIIADYIGRKRTMILAILAYSLTTGLSALAWDWVSFAVLRFLVGVAIGSEWATGASIVSELWPDHARGKGGGLLQCGAGLGGILASLVWLAVDVPDWCASGSGYCLDQTRHSGVAALGGGERAAPCGTCNATQRCCARRRKPSIDALYGGRSVRGPLCSPAADLRIPDDAVSDLRILGRQHLYSDLCRLGCFEGRAVGSYVVGLGGPRH